MADSYRDTSYQAPHSSAEAENTLLPIHSLSVSLEMKSNGASHPDFSFGASLLQLGFYRSNGGVGIRTIIADIDDISFNIDFTCTI